MSIIKPADKVDFINERLEDTFNSLAEDDWLKKAIQNTIDKLKENAFYGENIPKKQIPKEYIQNYRINNLYWCSLPNAWRLVYSVTGTKTITILALIPNLAT